MCSSSSVSSTDAVRKGVAVQCACEWHALATVNEVQQALLHNSTTYYSK
jgi:hypothetical protein